MKIVVIGATSGIAEHCCRLWAAEQSVEFVLVARDQAKLEKVAADLRIRGPHSTVATVHGDFLDRNVGIDPMLVEKVNGRDPQPPQRVLRDLPNAFGTAVEAARTAKTKVEAKLSGDHDILLKRLKRLADEFLVRERTIDLGGVKEGDASLDRRPDQGDHLFPVGGRSSVMIHAHAAQADGRDRETAVSKLACAHPQKPLFA